MSDGLALCPRGGGGCSEQLPPSSSSSSSFLLLVVPLLTYSSPTSFHSTQLVAGQFDKFVVRTYPPSHPAIQPPTNQPTHPPTHPPTHLSQTKQQFLLACLSLGVLVVKRYREHPPRPIVIWALDSSKQCFGAVRLPPTHPPTHLVTHSINQPTHPPTHPPTYHRGLPT